MYYRSHKPPYKKNIIYIVVVTSAIALVVWGGNSLKTELEETRAAATMPGQNVSSNYIPNTQPSQETSVPFEKKFDTSRQSESPENENRNPPVGKSSSPSDSSSQPIREENSSKKDYYIVTVYDGNIAVFKNTDKKPITVLDCPVSYFPKEDQTLLQIGIRVESLNEAMQLLEDYQ